MKRRARGLSFVKGARRAFVGALTMAAAAGAANAEILTGPYVNRVGSGSARVLWVTGPGVKPGEIALSSKGTRTTITARTSGFTGRKEILQTAFLEGLDPATRYEYEVRSGRASATGSFRTAPAEGARDVAIRFVAYGDTRSRPDKHRSVADGIAGEAKVSFVAHSGDLVSSGDKWEQWEEQFFGPGKRFLRQTALWPVRGNHERDGVFYRELFDLPGNEFWYSFDWGNIHFTVLDSQVKDDREAMVEWLKRDLAASEAEWKIVSYHKPTFNVGGHASRWGWKDILPVLEEHGVDVVLTGHSHIYERFRPIGPAGKKPIIHIVTGGGGAPTYDPRESELLEGGTGSSDLHYCVFDVEGNELRMVVKRTDGTEMDRMELIKRDGMYQNSVMKRAVDTLRARSIAHTPRNRKRR